MATLRVAPKQQQRIEVKACGGCHSDVPVKEALWLEISIRAFKGTKSRASSKNGNCCLRRRSAALKESEHAL